MSFGKPGLAKAIDEMRERRVVTEWLGRGPVADRKTRVGHKKQLRFRVRLVKAADIANSAETATKKILGIL